MKRATKSDAIGLLAALERANFTLYAEGDSLMVKSKLTLPDQLRQRLIEHKPELLQIAPRERWRVKPPGKAAFIVTCDRLPMTADEIRSAWPGARVEAAS